ncbi:MAG: acyl carrier protein [Spirochaetota bacterium]
MQSVQETIINFIKENFIIGRSEINLLTNQSLLDSGIIDSTGVLELVMFLEEKYSIKIEDEELIPENLDSIDNIVKYLKIKDVN